MDVVAYRSLAVGLAVGHHAVNGSKEFSSVYGRYLFYFSSLKNKLEFEVGHPAGEVCCLYYIVYICMHISIL